MNHEDFFKIKDGWNLEIENLKEEQLVHYGSNLLCGNGYLGYRGTLEEWGKDQYQACIVSDTYDKADGKWKELSNSPNALITEVMIAGKKFGDYPGQDLMNTELDFNYKYGFFKRISESKKDNEARIISERFASYDNLHLIANNYQLKNIEEKEVELKLGINGDVWDLNGTHLENFRGEYDSNKNIIYLKANTVESKITLVTALSFKFKKGEIKINLLTGSKRVGYWNIKVAAQLARGEEMPQRVYLPTHFVMTEETAKELKEKGFNVDRELKSWVTPDRALELFDNFRAELGPENN